MSALGMRTQLVGRLYSTDASQLAGELNSKFDLVEVSYARYDLDLRLAQPSQLLSQSDTDRRCWPRQKPVTLLHSPQRLGFRFAILDHRNQIARSHQVSTELSHMLPSNDIHH